MGAWPTAAAALADLRTFVNDGPQDKLVKVKSVVGDVNAINQTFYTYEDRVVNDGTFTPIVNFADLVSGFSLVDPIQGRFTITPAPVTTAKVRARYYYQYFLDAELTEALQMAAGQIVESDDITLVAAGFKLAALNYAGYFGFKKQAIRWAVRMSEKFLLEDSPVEGDPQNRSNLFNQLANEYLKAAKDFRNDVYTGQGQRNIPQIMMIKARIPNAAPRR